MAYKVNLEAAVEIPRQLRLRDLGGLVVIDFIDMRDQRHNREVERRLKEEIKKDKAKITVGRISKFGLLEMSRQHLGLNILRGSYRECPVCQGSGLVRSAEATALDYFRKIWLTLVQKRPAVLKAVLPADAASYLLNRKRAEISNLENLYKASIIVRAFRDRSYPRRVYRNNAARAPDLGCRLSCNPYGSRAGGETPAAGSFRRLHSCNGRRQYLDSLEVLPGMPGKGCQFE